MKQTNENKFSNIMSILDYNRQENMIQQKKDRKQYIKAKKVEIIEQKIEEGKDKKYKKRRKRRRAVTDSQLTVNKKHCAM